ncbi:hypothetical protein R5W24_002254 [Gemmata sp. JC717]|uniref:Uncharacterized protein n=1 Tax=Gemmata algarum TaxID=2975278 RepID=A0ABU5F5P8_9BACT|nr:hypothetical protein [Gemmata algarum]MDY3553162.1 hypothetical protein [Gemmata algarum]MDY3562824.1 hypothetical protein [Gemmata algarum]
MRAEFDERFKWVVAGGGVAFVVYALGQFVLEVTRVSRQANRPREPWEID